MNDTSSTSSSMTRWELIWRAKVYGGKFGSIDDSVVLLWVLVCPGFT